MSRFFHFTLGPVQSFVAQARRTRDFWAGSFLLSYFSAVAMRSVQKQGGEILFPAANERFLGWLEGNPGDGAIQPIQGEVPNRFKARVDRGFEPQLIVDSVQAAWSQLAEHVWRRDMTEHAALDSETRKIWTRQVESFWDIVWAVSSDPAASDLIERRKHWRTFQNPPEPGTKCMLMDGLQELSGTEAPDADAQNSFWGEISRHRGLDFREGEHLCALAFIKRRFAQHFRSFAAAMPGDWVLRGWDVPRAVPSVAHLAVAPWLARVVASKQIDAMENFRRAASRLLEAASEQPVTCVRQAVEASERPLSKFAALGADLFYEETLDNPRLYADRDQTMRAKRALLELRAACSELGAPSPFYAILAMDGDDLGKNMQEVEHQEPISTALEQFTERVGSMVLEHSGFLVYAGGDDVLALLPLDEALRCAQALRLHYRSAFEGTRVRSTLSGAIVYAHFRVPLTRVLSDAQNLLKNLAKNARQRDAIAARVVTPGGKTFEWAMPWTIACRPSPYAQSANGTAEDTESEHVALEEIADGFCALSGAEVFSSSFFYRIRELFALLNPRSDQHSALTPEEAVALMTAEYLGSGVHEGTAPPLEEAKRLVGRLLQQCRPVTRTLTETGEAEDESRWRVSHRLEADGALLARFLARKGVD